MTDDRGISGPPTVSRVAGVTPLDWTDFPIGLNCQFVVVQRFCPIKWKTKMSLWLVDDGRGFA